MIELELHKDWYFFVLENDDATWKPRIGKVRKEVEKIDFPFFYDNTARERIKIVSSFWVSKRIFSLVAPSLRQQLVFDVVVVWFLAHSFLKDGLC